jgi:hypothetical protein
MKPWLPVSIALCLAIPTLASGEEVLLDGIAAQVGNEIVLLSEVMVAAGPTEQRARAAGASERDIVAIRTQALDGAI